MHILFVHQNYPAQFGHIARHLVRAHGLECTFVTTRPPGEEDAGVRLVPYRPVGGAHAQSHYCSRSFENAVAHCHGVYEACRARPDLRPDLVVGHSGFGSTLFLRELYGCPLVNYFEYYYHTRDSDLDFRPEFPPEPLDVLRAGCRNAMVLLDLEACRAGYAPTAWQRSLLPLAYRDKVEVIFDGIDTAVWRRHEGLPRQLAGRALGPGTRIVTYVARGFEAMRGFDIFLRVAKRVYRAFPDVLFVVVGSDRVVYGGDLKHTGGKTFREYALARDDYDLSKFIFPGTLPAEQLVRLLSLSDLHIYLTVPFVLSWSLFDALACGCTVVASDTAPVAEVVRHGENGLLAGFYDVDGLAELALAVLRDPAAYRHLGEAGRDLIERKYALAHTLPRLLDLYQRAASGQTCAGAS